MSLTFEVLGLPGRDNALFVRIDSGQAIERLLFDCGEGCLSGIPMSEVQAIDALFFSHLHMDHVAGFDSFFRTNYQKCGAVNRIFGPASTRAILAHRFRGFLWNLHEELEASWRVSDYLEGRLGTSQFELREAFSVAHPLDDLACDGVLLRGKGFTVQALEMDHHTPSLAYLIKEHSRLNIDASRLSALGLSPGPWLNRLKEALRSDERITVDNLEVDVETLKQTLVRETPGDSIAYLTDFRLDAAAIQRLGIFLRGCRTLVCESQYRQEDEPLARRHAHMTSVQAATLAGEVGADRLILIHVSSRYDAAVWLSMLEDARAVFPNTSYPSAWSLPLSTSLTQDIHVVEDGP